jgi:hypothetical protein
MTRNRASFKIGTEFRAKCAKLGTYLSPNIPSHEHCELEQRYHVHDSHTSTRSCEEAGAQQRRGHICAAPIGYAAGS